MKVKQGFKRILDLVLILLLPVLMAEIYTESELVGFNSDADSFFPGGIRLLGENDNPVLFSWRRAVRSEPYGNYEACSRFDFGRGIVDTLFGRLVFG